MNAPAARLQLENDDDGEPGFRAGIQRRYTDLSRLITESEAELRTADAVRDHAEPDPLLLEQLPQLDLRLADLPARLQRRLYDAFRLEMIYNRPRHEVHIRVSLRAETARTVTTLINERTGHPEGKPVNKITKGVGMESRTDAWRAPNVPRCEPSSSG